MQNACLTAKQVAERLGVSVKTVWNWCNTGKLKAFKIGTRNYRIDPAALNDFIESRSVPDREKAD